jgi:hypothetical protein
MHVVHRDMFFGTLYHAFTPNKLQMDFKNIDPNSGNVEERNSKSMQFFFLENC